LEEETVDQERQKRLEEVAAIAVRLEAETQVPAAAIIAQWALESQWGSKPVGTANYFGIKKSARHAQCCTVTTHEVVNGERITQNLEFADYASLADSCADYAWLISHGAPYSFEWLTYLAKKDVAALISGIARRYATDPDYAALATQIAQQSNVQQAIRGARE
jgi:flagellum-specific peptidoglycan hydrolase FlgJ